MKRLKPSDKKRVFHFSGKLNRVKFSQISRNLRKFFSLAATVFVFDFATKFIAEKFLVFPISIAPFFSLEIAKNPGVAFSIPLPFFWQIFFGVIFLTGLFFFARRPEISRAEKIGAGLIFGGGAANLAERIARGAVTDFLNFSFWPNFNFADSAICVGAFFLIFFAVRKN